MALSWHRGAPPPGPAISGRAAGLCEEGLHAPARGLAHPRHRARLHQGGDQEGLPAEDQGSAPRCHWGRRHAAATRARRLCGARESAEPDCLGRTWRRGGPPRLGLGLAARRAVVQRVPQLRCLPGQARPESSGHWRVQREDGPPAVGCRLGQVLPAGGERGGSSNLPAERGQVQAGVRGQWHWPGAASPGHHGRHGRARVVGRDVQGFGRHAWLRLDAHDQPRQGEAHRLQDDNRR
mmetsp:Transcript_64436/g.201771  ORF Transcript_64436/g.201771 Transcript_64436/m.201771 type:complete len:237 (+) Transcript_64436:191-901(+)